VLARVLPQLKIRHVRRATMLGIMLKANQLLSYQLSTGATRSNGRRITMAFNIETLLKGFLGDSESSTKKTNNKNAKKRIIDDGGKAKLRADQAKDSAKKMKDSKGQGYSGTGINSGTTRVRKGPKRSTLVLTDGAGTVTKSKDNLKDRKIALAAKKKAALAVIKKDTNIVNKKKNKGTIVTKEQLEKSGLSLRDYMNYLKSEKTGRKISRDSRFDKKKKPTKGANT